MNGLIQKIKIGLNQLRHSELAASMLERVLTFFFRKFFLYSNKRRKSNQKTKNVVYIILRY